MGVCILTQGKSTLNQLEVRGSHFEIGLAIGERFSAQIHWALDGYSLLQEQILPFHHTPEGEARYRALLKLHQDRFPGYVSELEGVAEGARRPFQEIFLVNMRGEYKGYLGGRTQGCSDCALLTERVALIGHNEDGSPAFADNLYVLHAEVEGKQKFTALSYPGFLCGNAFGFNADGVCISVDDVRPQEIRVGVGRHFVARSLLEAHSLNEAIERATPPGRASGFSYTLGALQERRIVHVEVAPEVHHLHPIQDAFFHANHYLHLTNLAQSVSPSSRARVKRAQEIFQERPPQDAAGLLALLGDQKDEKYPIYRTATDPDADQTFCTALFDLDARTLRIYTAHPAQTPEAFSEFTIA
jgi:predicted choloylglycine hydrolase